MISSSENIVKNVIQWSTRGSTREQNKILQRKRAKDALLHSFLWWEITGYHTGSRQWQVGLWLSQCLPELCSYLWLLLLCTYVLCWPHFALPLVGWACSPSPTLLRAHPLIAASRVDNILTRGLLPCGGWEEATWHWGLCRWRASLCTPPPDPPDPHWS